MIANTHLLFVFFFRWWPEVPVILAIIAATGIMGLLCHHVYKIETQTTQYTSIGASLSMKVFKQSCWFVIAFYITWVPYLTLQVNMTFCALHSIHSLLILNTCTTVYVVLWSRI